MIKVTELQIGDWVQNPLGWKAQVQSIRYVNTIKDEWEWLVKIGINNETFQNNLSLTELEPIPLTAEILEKNGFEKDPESGELIWTDDDVTEVVWVGTILTIRGEYANAEFATCMFVHQLQHALRLCEIEHEITL